MFGAVWERETETNWWNDLAREREGNISFQPGLDPSIKVFFEEHLMYHCRTVRGHTIGLLSMAVLWLVSSVIGMTRTEYRHHLGSAELNFSRGSNGGTQKADGNCDDVYMPSRCSSAGGPCRTCPGTYPKIGNGVGQFKPPASTSLGDCGAVSDGMCVAQGNTFVCQPASRTQSPCSKPPGEPPTQVSTGDGDPGAGGP